MKVSATHYERGELMAPRPLDVKLASPTPGGVPTTDAGFYHRFKFEGRTKVEFDQKIERFVAEMTAVPGFTILTAREYDVKLDHYVRHGVDVLYVIEAAAAAPRRVSTSLTRRA